MNWIRAILLFSLSAVAAGEDSFDPCGHLSGPAKESCEFSREQLQNPGPGTTWNGASLEPRAGETLAPTAFPAGNRAESDSQTGTALIRCSDRVQACLQECRTAPREGTEFGMDCYQQCAQKTGCGGTLATTSIINSDTGIRETVTNSLGETLPTEVGPVSVNAPEGYAIDFDDTR